MGLFSIFSDKGSDSDIKVRTDGDTTYVADKFTHTNGRSEHVHESYSNNYATGKYTEYRGGEHSEDRTYNKGAEKDGESGGSGK